MVYYNHQEERGENMRTIHIIKTILTDLKEDATWSFDEENNEFDVCLNDFAGFYPDGRIRERYNDEDLVDEFEQLLEIKCADTYVESYGVTYYYFKDFTIRLTYSSVGAVA